MSNTVDIDHLDVDLSKCDYIDIDFRKCKISSFATGWQNGDPVGCDIRIYASYNDFKNHNNASHHINYYYKRDALFKDTYYTYDVDVSVSDDPDTRNNDDYLKYYFPLGSYIVIQRGIIRSPINEQTTTIYKSDGYLVITAVPLSYESIGGEYVTFNGYLTINGILDDIEFRTVRVTDKDYNTLGYTLRVYKVNADGTPVTSHKPDTSEGSGSSYVPPTIPDTDTEKSSLKVVDLGLSVKWANLNIGATEETDSGNYYAWGSIQTSDIYNQNSYEWYDVPTESYKIPATNIAATKYDVATQTLGGRWRMPNEEEFKELIDKCTWVATGNGFRVIGPNGNEIFLPFTGMGNGNSLNESNKMFYWSCKYNELPLHKEDHWAYYLTNSTFGGKVNPTVISNYVYKGMCIRPVEDDSLTPSTPGTPSGSTSSVEDDSSNSSNSGNSSDSSNSHNDVNNSHKDNNSNITITFTDTGTVGYSVDPNEILYAGGQEVIPKTFAQKDNTLFMGNYKEKRALITDEGLLRNIKRDTKVGFAHKNLTYKGEFGSLYMYNNQLKFNSYDITSFKGGEWYRFGLIFQDKRGQWSGVVPLGDYKNTLYPDDFKNYVNLVGAIATLDPKTSQYLYKLGYRRVQGVVVYPTIGERNVICQGVLCPTVYNIKDRKNNSPYAQSSWFFRDIRNNINYENKYFGVQNIHNGCISNTIKQYYNYILYGDSQQDDRRPPIANIYNNLNYFNYFNAEISAANATDGDVYIEDSNSLKNIATSISRDYNFYVDWNIVTMNSPELDFSLTNTANNIPTEGLKMRIVGVIPLTSCSNDTYISTSTPTSSKKEPFVKQNFTFTNNSASGYRLKISTLNEWIEGYDKQNSDTSNTEKYKEYLRYPIYPWQSSRSLTNTVSDKDDTKIYYNEIKKKIISNIRTSSFTHYFSKPHSGAYAYDKENGESISYDISDVGLYSGDIPLAVINNVSKSTHKEKFNYYGEVDTVLSSVKGYITFNIETADTFYRLNGYTSDDTLCHDPIRMRYKSSPHAVFELKNTDEHFPSDVAAILPYIQFSDSSSFSGITAIGNNGNNLKGHYAQYHIQADCLKDYKDYGFLYIAELYRDIETPEAKQDSNMFGGETPFAYEQNQWHKAGPVVELNTGTETEIEFNQGDTYYQRYDCLKTYPYSSEDPNQIIEILSFMCETRMNIDGRYDINRGNSSNLNATPQNFNLFNPVYTQENNFINNYYLDPEKNKNDNFSNTLLWTKTKTLGEEIDSWTNINQASTFNLDGDKGAISAVRSFNDNLIAFQDNGIARILYNERVQVNTSDGVPIELSNSGKVSGKQYLSDTIGCSNKETIQITPSGVYFMDSNSKDICLFNNGIQSVSKTKGFNSYLYDRDFTKYKTFYDKKLKDIYFTDDVTSLVYSEQLGEFEGFYSYGGTDYMFNYLDDFIAIKDDKLWKQFAGDYNYFFGSKDENCKPFSITLISNEGGMDKTFTNIEYEADTWDDKGKLLNETFDYLNIWNEYQFGMEELNKNNINNHYHYSNLKRKFRIWRTQLPRELKFDSSVYLPNMTDENNVEGAVSIPEREIDISKVFNIKKTINRIRNTWAYVKLSKNSLDNHKTSLHNINIGYFY